MVIDAGKAIVSDRGMVVGMYGPYGLAKMGVKADEIIKHYYTGVDVTKAY